MPALSYADLQRHIATLKGWDRDPANWPLDRVNDAHEAIVSGINKFYESHQWSFLRVRGTIETTAPYTTGTVEITPDASGSIVTLTTGSWPTWAADGELQVDGGRYLVKSRTDASEIILENTNVTVAAGETYSLVRFRYPLPADYASLMGPMTYDSTSDNLRVPLRSTHESSIRRMLMNRDTASVTENPTLYAIYPNTHDLTAAQGFTLEVFPPPQYSLVLRFMYRSWPAEVDSLTNIYPVGGETHVHAMVCAVLSEAEVMLKTRTFDWAEKWERALPKAIKNDQEMATPEYMPAFRNPTADAYYADQYGDCGGDRVVPGITTYEGHEDAF